MQYILYLHGFHSSPNSEKAAIFKHQIQQCFPEVQVIAPQLPCRPQGLEKLLNDLCNQYSFVGVVGSSLGGYLATYLHNRMKIPAVVVNPAVKPYELLSDYIGAQTHPITGEQYELTEHDMLLLKTLDSEKIAEPNAVWLLQQEQDEVLDYRQALSKYRDCRITFELGGCHGFDSFERFPIEIVKFLTKQSDE
ncbi:MAG: esterase YqiA [Gammaproteobacteria bacterium]|nr:esterase YqiA [Gammaproteobacteria bacterium]